ncbi:uncharacterized protein LOC110049013 [Orbicella faveolata]|uniref:uncharacterized protein LOC110049013 n=1 Tax=Orbicella faveolata TaxID=48498 RepID=UPI0009E42036|nr:uncharacterized protein LOC110049013 [Orbicella faveolata]
MQEVVRGNTNWVELREQRRKERQDELGVCRIRRIEEDQNAQTLGSGFVVKDLPIIEGLPCPYCLISSDKVFPSDCNIQSYYLDFRKLNTQKLKTVKLEDIAGNTHITQFPGLVVIPINPSKKCKRNQSIFTYRPFKVASEGVQPNEDLLCHFVDDGQTIFSVKGLTLSRSGTIPVYQLHEVHEHPYRTYEEVTGRGDRKPYGAAILKRSSNEFMVAGALTFRDNDRRDISPVFFTGLPLSIVAASATNGYSDQNQSTGEPVERVREMLEEMGFTPWARLNLHMKEALNAFLECLSHTYHLAVTLLQQGSLRITVQFQTLNNLELLWSDYQSRILDEKAEKYLVTDDIKNKLNVKAVALKTEILEQDYLACKHSLEAISGEC